MRLRFFWLLVFCFLYGRHLTTAQEILVDKEINKIDSLVFYCNFTEGEKEANRLYEWLSKSSRQKEYNEAKLQLQFYQAYIQLRTVSWSKALEVSLSVIDKAKKYNLPDKEYSACLLAAEIYETVKYFDICKKYLDEAYQLYTEYHLESVYAVYCVRLSSYYHCQKQKDSAIHYAYKGLGYAKKYRNRREYIDACLLLGMLLSDYDYHKAIAYSTLAAQAFLNKNDYSTAEAMYHNIASVLLEHKENAKALLYSDSCVWVSNTYPLPISYRTFWIKYKIYEALNNKDSAYAYFKKFHDLYIESIRNMEASKIKKVTEQYQNDKKEAELKSKNQQMIFIVSLLAVIVLATLLLIRKNRQISRKNNVINNQLAELSQTLNQKQVLLSELQHRVKNNLQHVISILEIQKESVDFNNIDELIRGNQNRIHSMALLHKKLNVSDNVNEVDLKKYISELADLVKDSYDSRSKKVNLQIECSIEIISLEKALPLGLIIVELVSNSMKHAFSHRSVGLINIDISKDESTGQNRLYYADNGKGFDFNLTSAKGLGLEIIKGLTDQLGATVETKNENGFELTAYFK